MARVTIKDIAQKAGVSITSVSFAFNKPEQLSETTLEHILKVADDLGYMPDPTASNLKTRQTGCIGLLVPQPLPIIARNPHLLALLEGIGTACHEHGYSLMLVPPLKGNLRRAIVRAAVDGFLTMGLETFRDTMLVLQQRHVPFVMIDSDPTPDTSCVNIDDSGGGFTAMQYALEQGHRQIAILGIRSGEHGDFTHYAGTLRRRVSGYQEALAAYGLEIDNRQVRLLECECDMQGGYDGFHKLWSKAWRPTLILAMADIMALGVLQAAAELGVVVPDDVSLIGCDNIEASVVTSPPLTTIDQPISEKGYRAVSLLDQHIHHPDDFEPQHVTLPTSLLVRDSCRTLSP